MPKISKDTVVVTGFGPFGGHKVNASSVAVQELGKKGLDDDDVELVTFELMPVQYESVKKIVLELWEKYNPTLMVHVGVSGVASELTLEQLAHNTGYTRPDVEGLIPPSQQCVNDCCHEVIRSSIHMGFVCEDVNQTDFKVKAIVSHDPGRYLCDFSYFVSLHKKKDCSAFIHVPPLNAPYTGTELAEGLRLSIKSMLKQVRADQPV